MLKKHIAMVNGVKGFLDAHRDITVKDIAELMADMLYKRELPREYIGYSPSIEYSLDCGGGIPVGMEDSGYGPAKENPEWVQAVARFKKQLDKQLQ